MFRVAGATMELAPILLVLRGVLTKKVHIYDQPTEVLGELQFGDTEILDDAFPWQCEAQHLDLLHLPHNSRSD